MTVYVPAHKRAERDLGSGRATVAAEVDDARDTAPSGPWDKPFECFQGRTQRWCLKAAIGEPSDHRV
jgi:hypothetical protein